MDHGSFDAPTHDEAPSGTRRVQDDDVQEEQSGRQSLLLFVMASTILVVCIVAGFVSAALLEHVERRIKQASIDTPDFE